jgi:hypothetical protein
LRRLAQIGDTRFLEHGSILHANFDNECSPD